MLIRVSGGSLDSMKARELHPDAFGPDHLKTPFFVGADENPNLANIFSLVACGLEVVVNNKKWGPSISAEGIEYVEPDFDDEDADYDDCET